MSRGCGSCNACCKLLNVPDISKPARMLCWWTTVHGGCARQAEKPDMAALVFGADGNAEPQEGKDMALQACAQFKCLWLASQTRDDPGEVMPRHWRPDMSHVVMGPHDREDPLLLHVQVDPDHPTAWRDPDIFGYLSRIVERGGKVEIILGEIHFELEA